MTRNELIQLIYSEIDNQANAVGKSADWVTAKESVMQEILQGVIAGIDVDVTEERVRIDEQRNKINEIIAVLPILMISNAPTLNRLNLDQATVLQILNNIPTALIQPLT